jgi:hypothetical protein
VKIRCSDIGWQRVRAGVYLSADGIVLRQLGGSRLSIWRALVYEGNGVRSIRQGYDFLNEAQGVVHAVAAGLLTLGPSVIRIGGGAPDPTAKKEAPP